MAKRPSYRSIRLRQRNIVEGIGTKDIRYTEAAQRLGVTKAELRRFLEQKPQTLHQNYNRSPSYKVLFEKGARGEVRKDLGIQRVRVYKWRERDAPEKDKQIARMLQLYYATNGVAKIEWATLTREHMVPTSIDAIKLLYRNGKITKSEYKYLVNEWKRIYGVKDDYAARYADLIEDDEEED